MSLELANPTVSNESLIKLFHSTRSRTVTLCRPLAAEDTVVQPIVDVSPPKWHLGHSTWFFENFILAEHATGYKLFDPQFNYLFNSYYETQGPRVVRSNRGNLTRPTTEQILAYRAHVDRALNQLLQDDEQAANIRDWVMLGIQHEMQHQELLVTDIKYILGHNPLFPRYTDKQAPSHGPSAQAWIEIPNGLYNIGFDGEGFCFDNELGKHQVFLHGFAIAKRLTTNGEYLAFLEDGGYEHPELWLMEGWEWLKQQPEKAPLYWHRKNGEWHTYTLSGLRQLDLNEPVTHISFYEADAFARWSGHRLPTEFEWEAACKAHQPNPATTDNLLEQEYYHPIADGQQQNRFYGNLWQWTNSAYLPYPFYEQAAGALGEYNGKFMVNQMVLRGGSCATPFQQIRASYRNFFHADKQWQFSGIRLAKHL